MRLELARSTRNRDHKLRKARLFVGATPFRLLTATTAVFATVALLGGVLAPRGEAAATISAELVKVIDPGGSGALSSFTVAGGVL